MAICACAMGETFAQTNLDLEAWSPIGVGAENPDGWGSLNEFTLFGFPQSTYKAHFVTGNNWIDFVFDDADRDTFTMMILSHSDVGGVEDSGAYLYFGINFGGGK